MCLLTDEDIKNLMNESNDIAKLEITPFSEESLTPIGYDLRIGELCISFINGKQNLKLSEKIKMPPGDTLLIETLENLRMPKNKKVSGLIESKVSMVSKGLSHISTTIDPDWGGKLMIAVHNHSIRPIELICGETFCTAVFFDNKTPSRKESGKFGGRRDILFNTLAAEADNAKKIRDRRAILIGVFSIAVIILSFIAGYHIMGDNKAGLIAITSVGIGISNFIQNSFSKK